MKKTLFALAVLAASSAATAQSSVTLFGIVDTNFQSVRGDGNGHLNRLGNSGINTSRLGVRGTEDLGGGLAASFHLEGPLSTDDGRAGGSIAATNQATTVASNQGLNFSRRSTVSLAGPFGEVRLGRDYVPSYWNLLVFDPFGNVGVGSATNLSQAVAVPQGSTVITTALRASNGIHYFVPGNLGGFYGQAMYALGENASNVGATKDDGRHVGIRVGYASGPVNVAFGAGRTDLQAVNDYKTWNLGASYNFGVATAMAQFAQEKTNTGLNATELKNRSWLIGATVPVGAGQVRAAFTSAKIDRINLADAKGRQFAIGYLHNLSKRTAVYTNYARISNEAGGEVFFANGRAATQVGGDTSGFEVGIRHGF